ncbi:hypothetical protein K788_00038355 [Paraburkholderia caribensis MBA4]|uniref:Uncharacterized protein n=1 Tax=Paraburkholderia caribensis MBA4 TaxID=1323664 RepID=A0A0P0RG62_9BURK|nr:hypothetical protein K788_00038355 [Paraburkholderia caribensis MBA4]
MHAADTGATVFAVQFAKTLVGKAHHASDGFEWRHV